MSSSFYCTDGQVPSVLFPKHTELGRIDEFNVSCFEAIRLLSEFFAYYTHVLVGVGIGSIWCALLKVEDYVHVM